MKSCGPFITIALFHSGCKSMFHTNEYSIFFCLLSTQSLLEPNNGFWCWNPIFLLLTVTYISAFTFEWFRKWAVLRINFLIFLPFPHMLNRLLYVRRPIKTGRESSEISQISLTQPFGSVSKLIFSEIKSTLLQNKRKRWFLDAYFMKPFWNYSTASQLHVTQSVMLIWPVYGNIIR